ncbi:MAG TPA: SRPBCC family protein [Candidatus Dormibacteraeota bacterium]|nr:SRPBCC family protein [Candidatus Dormibacteraeota bacterium]
MSEVEASRVVEVDAATAWRVVNDQAYFGEVSPGLSRVEIISGHGTEAIRRCWDDKGNHWDESCPVYVEGRRITFQIDPETHPARRLIRRITGTHEVEPVPTGGTRVAIRFDFQLRYGLLGWALTQLVLPGVRKSAAAVVDGWQRRMLAEAAV